MSLLESLQWSQSQQYNQLPCEKINYLIRRLQLTFLIFLHSLMEGSTE